MSHVIESPGDEGIGRTLISVTVACGEAVAVVEMADDSLVEEQAVKINSPINRILEVFFMEALEIHPIVIRMDNYSRFFTSD